ncbi:hypothetical protein HCDSEM_185 [Candidatus Hodgkinia cicadicola Dsem]|nr:hypothetical protein HCDSEM_185 [Candidatus Hodgkinia cicadicola Dsem]
MFKLFCSRAAHSTPVALSKATAALSACAGLCYKLLPARAAVAGVSQLPGGVRAAREIKWIEWRAMCVKDFAKAGVMAALLSRRVVCKLRYGHLGACSASLGAGSCELGNAANPLLTLRTAPFGLEAEAFAKLEMLALHIGKLAALSAGVDALAGARRLAPWSMALRVERALAGVVT